MGKIVNEDLLSKIISINNVLWSGVGDAKKNQTAVNEPGETADVGPSMD